MDFLQFGLARVSAAKAYLASWTLVSFITLTAVTLALPSAEAYSIIEGTTALLGHLALAGGAFIAWIAVTFSTVAFAVSYKFVRMERRVRVLKQTS